MNIINITFAKNFNSAKSLHFPSLHKTLHVIMIMHAQIIIYNFPYKSKKIIQKLLGTERYKMTTWYWGNNAENLFTI